MVRLIIHSDSAGSRSLEGYFLPKCPIILACTMPGAVVGRQVRLRTIQVLTLIYDFVSRNQQRFRTATA